MESFPIFSVPSLHISTSPDITSATRKPMFFNLQSNPTISLIDRKKSKSTLFTALSPSVSTEPSTDPPVADPETEGRAEKFDWYSQWYPVMSVCDLKKRELHAKKVMGIDVVVWWDRNESAWKVFDDTCPHRLAPLSEGRIDQWRRLQCVYHGWCFDGAGDC